MPNQIDLIWTAADVTELDLAAAPNGGSARGYQQLSAPLAIPTTTRQTWGQAVCLCIARGWGERPQLPHTGKRLGSSVGQFEAKSEGLILRWT